MLKNGTMVTKAIEKKISDSLQSSSSCISGSYCQANDFCVKNKTTKKKVKKKKKQEPDVRNIFYPDTERSLKEKELLNILSVYQLLI